MAAYVQPLGDAIGIVCTLVTAALVAAALAFDFRGWLTRFAASLSEQYQRPIYRRLVATRRRGQWQRDPALVRRLIRIVAIASLAVFGPLLVVEVLILASRGVR